MFNIFSKFFTNSEEAKEDEEKGYNKSVEDQRQEQRREELQQEELRKEIYYEQVNDEQIRVRRLIEYREDRLREQHREEFRREEQEQRNERLRNELYSTQQLEYDQKEDNIEELSSLTHKKNIWFDEKNQSMSHIRPSTNRSSTMSPSVTPIRNNFQRITEKPHSTDIYFNNKDFMNSIALDILCIYIKGQKTLYTEAKTYCEQQLNFLMLPAIFISSITSVLSFVFNNTL